MKNPDGKGPGRPLSAKSLHAARTRKEFALAELREIEVREKRARLLEAEAVAAGWAAILRQVRAGMLAVPSRVRARLPHLPASDVAVIDDELRKALVALATAAVPAADSDEDGHGDGDA